MGKDRIGIEDAIKLDDKIWFCISEYASIGGLDIKTGQLQFYDIPIQGEYLSGRTFTSMVIVERKIYLIPFMEKEIVCFDVDKKVFDSIEIDMNIIGKNETLFMGGIAYQEYVFVMGAHVPVILRLNTNTKKIDYVTNWKNKIDAEIFDVNDGYFRKQCVVVEGKLYAPFCNANAIIEMDCEDLKTTVRKLGEETQGYSGICVWGEDLWLSPRKNGSVKKWNIFTQSIETILVSNMDELRDVVTSYVGIDLMGEEVTLFPAIELSENIYINNSKIKVKNGIYSLVHSDVEYVIFYERENGILTLWDRTTKEQIEFQIDDFRANMRKLLKGNAFVEKKEIDLKKMLDYIIGEK